MHKNIFVNLPIQDMTRSQAFFNAMGYHFNPQFTNEMGACLVLGDNLYAMLLVPDFFKGFTHKAITDTSQSTEVLICLSCDSRAEVDELVGKAVAAGGTAPRTPQDMGFMYSHGFEDLDGHTWELVYMDMAAAQAANPAATATSSAGTPPTELDIAEDA